MPTESNVEFRPPSGAVPEGVTDGKEFDSVCTFRVQGGKICLVMLGDTPMPGYNDKADARPDYSEMTKSIQGSMGDGEEQD